MGPFDLPLTKMGSRAPHVSLAHRHSGGHAPRQTEQDAYWSLVHLLLARRFLCVARLRVYAPTSAAGRYRSPFVNTAQAIRAIRCPATHALQV